MFGETNADTVIAEADACHKAHPNNHIRLVGFDNFKQSKGAEMVVFRGKAV
jgi:ribulose-bisphosphate carboxylase small chain